MKEHYAYYCFKCKHKQSQGKEKKHSICYVEKKDIDMCNDGMKGAFLTSLVGTETMEDA
jgi:hypothetical protein